MAKAEKLLTAPFRTFPAKLPELELSVLDVSLILSEKLNGQEIHSVTQPRAHQIIGKDENDSHDNCHGNDPEDQKHDLSGSQMVVGIEEQPERKNGINDVDLA
ncbi:hypothetical protein N8T08_004215 [Aspergillus melleus]|uniref:Uncharacterized protein n=1 Tax=Aspergillus melleus TaxID=138277 RepID=A0ACC3B4H7_9EURO|nr:hypothetical protein N8T08_004215 [Aspergillus melleus]